MDGSDGWMVGWTDGGTRRRIDGWKDGGWWMVDDTEYQIRHAMFLEKKGFI